MLQYQEQGGGIDFLEEKYKVDISDEIKQLAVNANIFDINIEEERFSDLSEKKLKDRKKKLAGFLDALRPAGSPLKHIRGGTMESRFRLSSITETEEIVKLRNESLELKAKSLFS